MSDADVVELLADALAVAWRELAQLSDTPIPLPDKLRLQLEERDALVATLKTVPDGQREALRETYRKELARTHRDDSLSTGPVLAEVLRSLEETYEVLRRRSIYAPELVEAVRRLGA